MAVNFLWFFQASDGLYNVGTLHEGSTGHILRERYREIEEGRERIWMDGWMDGDGWMEMDGWMELDFRIRNVYGSGVQHDWWIDPYQDGIINWFLRYTLHSVMAV